MKANAALYDVIRIDHLLVLLITGQYLLLVLLL